MMKRLPFVGNSDRGAILVHVAVALLMLIAFSAFAVDFGMFWLARGQAQNSADAGAIAGAIALDYDGATDLSVTGPAKQSALKATQVNLVLGVSPAVDPSTDINFIACPDGSPSPACIRVDVYRDKAHANPLPTWFGNIVGLVSQDTKATATAEAGSANATNCMRPWMIPDKWAGPNQITYVAPPDSYAPPDPITGLGGTGYTVANDYGTIVTLKPGNPKLAISPSDYYAINLTNSQGGADYRTNIGTCINVAEKIGDVITTEPGNLVGPTKQGVADLVAQDPGATWNATTKQVVGSAYAVSPRIVPVALFSPAEFMALTRTSGVLNLTIVNILGFFVQTISAGGDVTGVIISRPGELGPGTTVGPGASFLKVMLLVR